MWFHVDGAYGGFFQLTDRGRERFRGIERADSVTLDPHKGLFLPYGTGGLVVRDGAALRDAHYEGAAYLQDLPPTGDAAELQRATRPSSRGTSEGCASGSRWSCTAWPRSARRSTRSST